MGIALWSVSLVVALLIARIVPPRENATTWSEVLVAVCATLAAGALATALDFGGWNEPDWRAGTFTLLVAFGSIGALRAFRAQRHSGS